MTKVHDLNDLGAFGSYDTSATIGEKNVGQNIGDGEEIYAGKANANLQFKSIVSGDGITITADDDEIFISANTEIFSSLLNTKANVNHTHNTTDILQLTEFVQNTADISSIDGGNF